MPKSLERFGSLLMMNKTFYRVAKSLLKNTVGCDGSGKMSIFIMHYDIFYHKALP